MDSSAVAVLVLLGLVVLRGVLIAIGAALILRPVRECPACFDATFSMHRPWLRAVASWLEWRFCPRCGWSGPARRLPATARPIVPGGGPAEPRVRDDAAWPDS